MTKRLISAKDVIGLVGSTVDSRDIGSLLTKTAADLDAGKLKEAETKLDVLCYIFNHVPGCAFFRSTECNYYHYLGLRQQYEQLSHSDAPPRQ